MLTWGQHCLNKHQLALWLLHSRQSITFSQNYLVILQLFLHLCSRLFLDFCCKLLQSSLTSNSNFQKNRVLFCPLQFSDEIFFPAKQKRIFFAFFPTKTTAEIASLFKDLKCVSEVKSIFKQHIQVTQLRALTWTYQHREIFKLNSKLNILMKWSTV